MSEVATEAETAKALTQAVIILGILVINALYKLWKRFRGSKGGN